MGLSTNNNEMLISQQTQNFVFDSLLNLFIIPTEKSTCHDANAYSNIEQQLKTFETIFSYLDQSAT